MVAARGATFTGNGGAVLTAGAMGKGEVIAPVVIMPTDLFSGTHALRGYLFSTLRVIMLDAEGPQAFPRREWERENRYNVPPILIVSPRFYVQLLVHRVFFWGGVTKFSYCGIGC